MRHLPRFALGVAVAALVTASFTAPADARRYRHWDRNDGIDVGDVLLGAIIIGGIAAIATAASNASKNNGTVFGRDRDKRGDNSESAAVDACTDAAERQARDSGRDGRVTGISGVDRDGDRYRVRGTIDYRSGDGWGDRQQDWGRDRQGGAYGRDTTRFVCTYSYGEVAGVWFDDGYAYR